jgi:hypothetical protein
VGAFLVQLARTAAPPWPGLARRLSRFRLESSRWSRRRVRAHSLGQLLSLGLNGVDLVLYGLGHQPGLLDLLAQVGGMFIDDAVPVGTKKTATTSSLIIPAQNLESTQSG